MDVAESMGRLAGKLEQRMGYEITAAVLDGICELRSRREMEEAVCWLAKDYGLLDVISSRGEEVTEEPNQASWAA